MASMRGNELRIWNTRIKLWTVAILLSCFLNSNIALAAPEPGPFYAENFSTDPENMHLLQRLKQLALQERELNEQEGDIADEALAIEGYLEAKAGIGRPRFSHRELSEEDGGGGGEPLPIPSAQQAQSRYEKRGSYMALCHFKICNMGRKRQLMTQVRTKVPTLNSWVSFDPRSSSTLLRLPRA